MCLISNHEIKNLPFVNKMMANRITTEMQLAISKAGGKTDLTQLKQMSLQHFICLCSMNQIQVKFK